MNAVEQIFDIKLREEIDKKVKAAVKKSIDSVNIEKLIKDIIKEKINDVNLINTVDSYLESRIDNFIEDLEESDIFDLNDLIKKVIKENLESLLPKAKEAIKNKLVDKEFMEENIIPVIHENTDVFEDMFIEFFDKNDFIMAIKNKK